MKKFRAAVVGYGNIGNFTVEALEAAPDFKTKFACEVKDLNINEWIDRKEARKLDRYTQLTLLL